MHPPPVVVLIGKPGMKRWSVWSGSPVLPVLAIILLRCPGSCEGLPGTPCPWLPRGMALEVSTTSCFRFRRADLDACPRLLEQLQLRFTFPNPDPVRGGQGDAAQWAEKEWCALRTYPDSYTLPRGALDDLRKAATATGVELKFVSRATTYPGPTVPLEDFALTPRPYQRDIIGLLVSRVQGYVVLPCGGGKTTTGALAMLHIAQPGLVLVHTRDLLDQWAATFVRALGGDSSRVRRIGSEYGVDLRPLWPGEVAVAMVQALYEADGARDFLRSAAVLLADEVHHIAARQWRWITDHCPARWRWGLTATPDRADGWGFLLGLLLGPKLYELPALQLIEWGFLLRPTIVPVRSPWKPGAAEHRWRVTCPGCEQHVLTGWRRWQAGELVCDNFVKESGPRGGLKRRKCGTVVPPNAASTEDVLDWSVTLSALSDDPARGDLLVRLTAEAFERGRRSLVLMGRKSPLPRLAAALREHQVNAEAVASGTAARDERIAALRTGRLDALVATQLADEGLDVPALDCVVLGSAGKDKGKAKQRAGRACRPEGLPPIIFDVVDGGPELHAQWRKRARAYEEEYGAGCIIARQPLPPEEAIGWLDKIGARA